MLREPTLREPTVPLRSLPQLKTPRKLSEKTKEKL
jgi:hypothetical protein